MKKYIVTFVLHFLMDFFSMYLLYRGYANREFLYAAISYNMLAFFTQPLVGLWIRNWDNHKLVYVSFIMLAIGICIRSDYYLDIIWIGLANSLFHVAAGNLNIHSTNKFGPLGFFVAGGATGVALGSLYSDSYILYIVLLVVTLIVLLIFHYISYPIVDKEDKSNMSPWYYIALVMLAVFPRAFLGGAMSYGFDLTHKVIFIAVGATLGKSLGGIISDKTGPLPVIIFSNIMVVLGIFFNSNAVLGMLAIIGFNSSMALTLYYLYKSMPKNEGVAFGIAAMMLCFGTMLGNIFKVDMNNVILICIVILNLILNTLMVVLGKKYSILDSRSK